ncbi:MAG TPA: hypothetical protein VGQ95_02180 [Chthoniobacterales bacterium]|nr:hypothetical protein [Chthoniobacterales bacterium]
MTSAVYTHGDIRSTRNAALPSKKSCAVTQTDEVMAETTEEAEPVARR